MNAWEREEEQLEQDLFNGLITPTGYNKRLRDIQRDYREAAEEAAWDAYERERSNW